MNGKATKVGLHFPKCANLGGSASVYMRARVCLRVSVRVCEKKYGSTFTRISATTLALTYAQFNAA